MVRVRYAPSPTGLLHIGNARTALFNYLFAKKHKGVFVLRIEDTDVLRNVSGGEESQIKYLNWLGIEFDESPNNPGEYGPYRQLERLNIYQDYAKKLVELGSAYEEASQNGGIGIRFKVPKEKKYHWHDLVRGDIQVSSKDIEDWIILKDNGIPTYNFAVVIDDYLMKITHVLRGEEHITNTPKQLMIYEAFNITPPQFGHMNLIINKNGKKLSKRDADVHQFIHQYKELGYLGEAVSNFLCLLGYYPQDSVEVFKLREIKKSFNEHNLLKSPSLFDTEKLKYINKMHLRQLNEHDLVEFLTPFLLATTIKANNQDWLKNFILTFKERIAFGEQTKDIYQKFFREDFNIQDEAVNFLKNNNLLPVIREFLVQLPKVATSYDFENAINNVKNGYQGPQKNVFIGLRIATTGETSGPALPVQLTLLGLKVVESRLLQTIKRMECIE